MTLILNQYSARNEVTKIHLRQHDLSLVEIVYSNGVSETVEIKELAFKKFVPNLNEIQIKNLKSNKLMRLQIGRSSHFDIEILYALGREDVHTVAA